MKRVSENVELENQEKTIEEIRWEAFEEARIQRGLKIPEKGLMIIEGGINNNNIKKKEIKIKD